MDTPVTPIDRFKDEFGWLSNMHECPCHYDGKTFASSEHLYQWLKTSPGWWQDRIFEAPHGKVAKKLAANPKCPKAEHSDWDSFRLRCMAKALHAKFESNPDLRAKLESTFPRSLIEGNHWNDRFWGVCQGSGLNHLGKQLEYIREQYLQFGSLKPPIS